MKITRIDNGDGKESLHDIHDARDRIEGSGYYMSGTIDELLEEGKDFTLRTTWAHWRFEFPKKVI